MSVDKNGEKRTNVIFIELKSEIIDKHQKGVSVIDFERQHNHTTSTICFILKQKDSIKDVISAKGVKIISMLYNSVHDKTENCCL